MPLRKDMAALLGMPPDTLGTYERGVSEPGMALLATYHSRFGINLNWLLTGEGNPFHMAEAEPDDVVADTMIRLAAMAVDMHALLGQPLGPEKAAGIAAELYNELLAKGASPSDPEEVEAHLPALRLALRRRLEAGLTAALASNA